MNKEQYNNVIEHSIVSKETDDTCQLELTRDICNNMGVALPHGNVSEVSQILETDDYMFWRSCSKEEAQEYADNGVAAIAVTESDISFIRANTGEVSEPTETLSIADGSETTYYAYSAGTTNNTVTQIVEDGTYYLNNAQYGKYLQKENSSIKGISGLLADLGSSIKWKIEFKGSYYVIRYAEDPSQYLAATGMDSAAIQFTKVTSSTIPTSCRWKLSHATHGMGGILIKNVYNSRYLIWRGRAMLVESLGTVETDTYAHGAWRNIPISYDNRELSDSFSISNAKIMLNSSGYPEINKSPSNAFCASANDFSYSFSSDNISITNGNITGLKRGYVTVTATHKVTLKTTEFQVFVKNPSFDSNDENSLKSLFIEEEGGDVYVHNSALNYYTVSEALREVTRLDSFITQYCNEFGIPKEFVQTVLFKEIWCYKLDDPAADIAIRETYELCELTGIGPAVDRLSDCSTGWGQIYAKTAIDALNNAHDRGFIQLSSKYNKNNWRDVWHVWKKLNEDEEYNVMCCALVILDCQYCYKDTLSYDRFYEFNSTEIKKVLARYNGTPESQTMYGEDTYPYFLIFKSFI